MSPRNTFSSQRLLAGALGGEQGRELLIGVRPHQAELAHAEPLPVQADPLLADGTVDRGANIVGDNVLQNGAESLYTRRYERRERLKLSSTHPDFTRS
jgi:hypothetical protein